MYAIVKISGKQYKVSQGDIIEVNKLEAKLGDSLDFDQVLLFANDDNITAGNPLVSDILVTGKVLDQIKGEKIKVAKYKSKVRYRRSTGFRALLTRLQIEKIGKAGEKKVEPEAKPEKKTRAPRKTTVKKNV